jgi:pimeloyl-ACP methyl ester carboxylesterase
MSELIMQGRQETVTLPGGYQIAAYHFGSEGGTPVVLLHGGGIDSAMLSWRDTIPALAQAGYRIYAFDWSGYGQSPPAPVGFTQDLLVDVAKGLFDAWQLEKASLVGISMGGGAALGFTLAHPQRVEKLVLVGSYGLQDKVAAHFLSALYVKLPLMNAVTYALLRSSRWMMRETMKAIIRRPASLTESLLDEADAALRSPGAGQAFASSSNMRWLCRVQICICRCSIRSPSQR